MVSKKICKTHHQVYGALGGSEIADEGVFLMTCLMKRPVRSKTGKKNGASNSAISEFKALFFLSDTVVLKIEEKRDFRSSRKQDGRKERTMKCKKTSKSSGKDAANREKIFASLQRFLI